MRGVFTHGFLRLERYINCIRSGGIKTDGKPTTDPGEYEKGGTLLPFGGYKGYGLAMMVEKLAKCKEAGYIEILDETIESVERIEKELGL